MLVRWIWERHSYGGWVLLQNLDCMSLPVNEMLSIIIAFRWHWSSRWNYKLFCIILRLSEGSLLNSIHFSRVIMLCSLPKTALLFVKVIESLHLPVMMDKLHHCTRQIPKLTWNGEIWEDRIIFLVNHKTTLIYSMKYIPPLSWYLSRPDELGRNQIELNLEKRPLNCQLSVECSGYRIR